jgi:pseudaminic acid synthase
MEFQIGKTKIGKNHPTFIIAELSANHNHKYDIAVKTIKAAKKAGADAIKLQTYTADTITIDSDKKYFQIKGGTLWDGKTLHKLYQEAYTPWEWQPKLKKLANQLGMECFSSPFDHTAVTFLEKMRVPAYKIASFEINDIPLIENVARKGKPILFSTGIATLGEIREAVNACKRVGNEKIILLKCTSSYPATIDQANLLMIPDMEKRFKVLTGLSDHTSGIVAPVAATMLGAKIVEKHFILDRKAVGGPDAEFSIEPKEFKEMVTNIRDAEKSLGKVSYALSAKTKKNRVFARSLFVVENVNSGEKFTNKNVRSIRPYNGLPPKFLPRVIGKRAKRNLEKGTPLSWTMIK